MTKRTTPRRGATVEGQVESVSSSSDDGGSTWDQSLFLTPWREANGELREEELRIDVHVRGKAHAAYALEGKFVTAKVTDLGPSPKPKWFPGWTAVAASLPKRSKAKNFAAKKPSPPAPRKLRDKVLGALTVESHQLSVWRGPRGRQYEVLIALPRSGSTDAVLIAARSMVTRVEKSMPALREAIAAKLLATCNRWRAQEDEPPVTRTAFLRALQLASISVDPKSSSLIFECDDLFADHGVELRLTPRGRITHVSLA